MPAAAKPAVAEGRPLASWAMESAREFVGLSREDMAQELSQRLGRDYSKDAVKEMENGRRRNLKWDEVNAVSAITGFSIDFFRDNPLADSQSAWYGDDLELAAA